MSNIEGYIASVQTIESKARDIWAGKDPETYTEILLSDQNKRIQKLACEVGELVREECRPDFDKDRFIGEAADTVYALEVMVAARGLSIFDAMRLVIRESRNGRPTEEQMRCYLAPDNIFLIRSLGGSATGLILAECAEDFSPERMIAETANCLVLTNILISRRGFDSDLIRDELAQRNVEMTNRQLRGANSSPIKDGL